MIVRSEAMHIESLPMEMAFRNFGIAFIFLPLKKNLSKTSRWLLLVNFLRVNKKNKKEKKKRAWALSIDRSLRL